MRIRPATADDIPAMHEIRLSVRENRLSDPGRISAADYADAIGLLGRGWVAERDGAVVGFAIGYSSGNVWALFVDPAHEGRGVGGALHDALVRWLERTGASPLWLTTEPGTRAEAFYLARGWRARGAASDHEIRLERDVPGPVGP